MVFHYFFKLMMHLKNEEILNMTFFLLKILPKMVVMVRKRENPETR
jgi:hypothetical protein